jgi:hypothetical protein
MPPPWIMVIPSPLVLQRALASSPRHSHWPLPFPPCHSHVPSDLPALRLPLPCHYHWRSHSPPAITIALLFSHGHSH